MEIHNPMIDSVITNNVKVLIWEYGEERYEEWCIIALKKDDNNNIFYTQNKNDTSSHE